MPRRRPTFIWRKSASAAWLAANEATLQDRTSGAFAVIKRPRVRRLVVEAVCDTARTADELRSTFGGAVVELPRDWEARALEAAQSKPLRVGNRLTIVSDVADVPPRSAEAGLVIPAGTAFGTGEHATTAMSLRILERITRTLPAGWRMLDVGTGSGILALAASRFGAGRVIAIDNDPLAISTARANAQRNGIRGVEFRLGDARRLQRGTFDIIGANLYSELLIAALPLWRANLRTGGRLIISGVMRTQERDLSRALRRNCYLTLETRRRGKWIALLCEQKRS